MCSNQIKSELLIQVNHLNRAELVSILTRKLGERTNAEWNAVFEGARFPYGAVNSLKEVFKDPQVINKGSFCVFTCLKSGLR